ncbi:Outer membrane lipoprotein Omp16 precursor [compost metagenome]
MPELGSKRFVVEGHTDTTGGASHNLPLSQHRAAAVRDYLITKGVPADRLDSVGYGSSKLLPNLAPTDPSHRRVVVTFQEQAPMGAVKPKAAVKRRVAKPKP